jgi:hypothetical protein
MLASVIRRTVQEHSELPRYHSLVKVETTTLKVLTLDGVRKEFPIRPALTVQPEHPIRKREDSEAELEALTNANARFVLRFEELHASRSWRITAPLRSTARFLRNSPIGTRLKNFDD